MGSPLVSRSLFTLMALICCLACSRELTDPESIQRGYGPQCWAERQPGREPTDEPADNEIAFDFARSGGLYANDRLRGKR
jgi:hypothetical protein